jgi:hypothetical protein
VGLILRHTVRMRLVLLSLVAAAALVAPASAAAPATRLSITTWLENNLAPQTYVLTCGPAAVRGLPRGSLAPVDACRAVGLAGPRLYQPRLSRHVKGCNYVVAPRRAVIAGYRMGRRVRATVEVGACERLLVSRRVLERFVVWGPGAEEQ